MSELVLDSTFKYLYLYKLRTVKHSMDIHSLCLSSLESCKKYILDILDYFKICLPFAKWELS